MKVVITGGCGFLGLRLAKALLRKGMLVGEQNQMMELHELVLCDLASTRLPADPRVRFERVDVTDPDRVCAVLPGTDVLFHLAAVVSGAAEADFDLGMAINVHGTLHILEACRTLAAPPRLVFASSVAVYGGDMPAVIEDGTALTPQSSYGVQKALAELLINDYSRKGFIDGRALRLPTIVVRPGRPNRAASSFASSIIREPLHGERTECPVAPETPMWILSPRRAIEALMLAAELPANVWGRYRALALPGLSLSVGEIIEGLRRVAGERVVKRIHWQPDPNVENIVCSWPARFAPRRAESLGFKPDGSIDEVIQAFIDDELDGRYVS